jgi:hypothetical protein
MGLLNRLLGRTAGRNDPVFGALKHHDGQWSGRGQWAGLESPFAITVARSDGAPTDADRQVYMALQNGYPGLRLDLQEALWQLWTGPAAKALAQVAQGQNFIGSSIDLWSHLRLQGVNIHDDASLTLIYGFQDETVSDAAFCVDVLGRDVVRAEWVA